MASHTEVAGTIRARIAHGDYRMREFPSGLKLAAELGVNPRTVEKAMATLVQNGELHRSGTGRVSVNLAEQSQEFHPVLLLPAFLSPSVMLMHQILDRLTVARGWKLRPVTYVHFCDPIIDECLRGFDGGFICPGSAGPAPYNGLEPPAQTPMSEIIRNSGKPMVVLAMDTSSLGIPCIYMAAATGIRSLLDVLLPADHKCVACFNSQPMGPILQDRIDQWWLWTQVHGKQPQLINEPVAPFGSAMERAHRSMLALLKRGKLEATAIFCTTGAAALGIMRALSDCGLEPGRDVAVCAADDHGGQAPLLQPSLTCLKDPDISPYVDVCLDWFARGGDWKGPLCIHPEEMPVFVGESTSLYGTRIRQKSNVRIAAAGRLRKLDAKASKGRP